MPKILYIIFHAIIIPQFKCGRNVKKSVEWVSNVLITGEYEANSKENIFIFYKGMYVENVMNQMQNKETKKPENE